MFGIRASSNCIEFSPILAKSNGHHFLVSQWDSWNNRLKRWLIYDHSCLDSLQFSSIKKCASKETHRKSESLIAATQPYQLNGKGEKRNTFYQRVFPVMLHIQLCRRNIVAHFYRFVKMVFEKSPPSVILSGVWKPAVLHYDINAYIRAFRRSRSFA